MVFGGGCSGECRERLLQRRVAAARGAVPEPRDRREVVCCRVGGASMPETGRCVRSEPRPGNRAGSRFGSDPCVERMSEAWQRDVARAARMVV